MKSGRLKTRKYQTGIVTLSIAMLLLLIITIASLSALRISITEQLVSSNLYLEKQAFEAAQAGLTTALASIEKSTLEIAPESAILAGGTGNLDNGAFYDFSYRFIEETPENRLVDVIATGYADNGSATRTIQQSARFIPPLVNIPVAPLTSQGLIDVAGTHITSTTDGPLMLPGKEDLFTHYFGMSQTMLQISGENHACSECGEIMNGTRGKIIWLGNSAGEPVSLDNSTIGTPDDPVIVIVTNDLGQLSGTTFYGLLYILGETDSYGDDFELVGAMAGEGDISLQGDIDLKYDMAVLENLEKLGFFSGIAGSWRDF